MSKIPDGVKLTDTKVVSGDDRYEESFLSVLGDIEHTTGVMALAISMLHRLSPLQERDIIKAAQDAVNEYIQEIVEECGYLDYRDPYSMRSALANRLFRRLGGIADEMPQKTAEEMQEEFVFLLIDSCGEA